MRCLSAGQPHHGVDPLDRRSPDHVHPVHVAFACRPRGPYCGKRQRHGAEQAPVDCAALLHGTCHPAARHQRPPVRRARRGGDAQSLIVPHRPEGPRGASKSCPRLRFGTADRCDPADFLAADFQFVAPIIVGPLLREEFVAAFGGFRLKDAVPDLLDQSFFQVDPVEPNRVWFFGRAIGTHTGR